MSSRSPSPSGALSRQQSSRGMNPSSHRSRRGDADANGVAQMVGDVSDRSTMMPDSDMGVCFLFFLILCVLCSLVACSSSRAIIVVV